MKSKFVSPITYKKPSILQAKNGTKLHLKLLKNLIKNVYLLSKLPNQTNKDVPPWRYQYQLQSHKGYYLVWHITIDFVISAACTYVERSQIKKTKVSSRFKWVLSLKFLLYC